MIFHQIQPKPDKTASVTTGMGYWKSDSASSNINASFHRTDGVSSNAAFENR